MKEKVFLITGISGEVGHELIRHLGNKHKIIGLDVNLIDESLRQHVAEFIQADILDIQLLETVFSKYEVSKVFHLASILSTTAEKYPEKAHSVNVNGTFNLLSLSHQFSQKYGLPIQFLFPSTIAVYGVPKNISSERIAVKEDQHLHPITMYGINKLYCENLGKYFSENYKLLDADKTIRIDFRAIRFPGIISAMTMPTGGTSDYAPEMIHSAAKGEGYESFVAPNAILPFMTMPDAARALVELANTPIQKLSRRVYNITGFSATAQELAEVVNRAFPDSAISYTPDVKRQQIVDSWPADVDDTAAQKDWGWQPEYNLEKGFIEYLIPAIKEKYSN